MPLNAFVPKQTVIFQVVARRIEDTWSEPTLCTRVLLQDGSGIEVQATKEALGQWQSLPMHIAVSMEVMRTCLKPYRGENKTGISPANFLRFLKLNDTIQRSVTTFPPHDRKDREYVLPGKIVQQGVLSTFNVAGVVHDVGKLSSPGEGKVLPKRELEI